MTEKTHTLAVTKKSKYDTSERHVFQRPQT